MTEPFSVLCCLEYCRWWMMEEVDNRSQTSLGWGKAGPLWNFFDSSGPSNQSPPKKFQHFGCAHRVGSKKFNPMLRRSANPALWWAHTLGSLDRSRLTWYSRYKHINHYQWISRKPCISNLKNRSVFICEVVTGQKDSSHSLVTF